MRDIDIYVGQKYRVKEDVALYIKRGAVVVIRKKDGEFYRVQDLSKNKYLDGRWWLHYSRLEPLKGIDPEEIKEGLRVHHKECGNGTVATVSTKLFVIKWDKKSSTQNIFSRGGHFSWDNKRLWSCEELTILNEKESASDILQKLQKECDEALYDYSKRQCKEALEELKRLNTLNEEKLDGHCEGNKIIFTLVKGNKTIEASASCSPEDTFDSITGSQIALARLAQNVVNLQKYIYQKILKIFKLNLSKRHR